MALPGSPPSLTLLPDSCTLGEEARLFLVATRREGLLGRSLVSAPSVSPLPMPPSAALSEEEVSQQRVLPFSAAAADAAASTPSRWPPTSPVVAVAQAGDSSVAALLFGDAGPVAAKQEATEVESEEASSRDATAVPYTVTRPRHDTALSPRGRRHVHLVDLRSGVFLAELYFRGAIICGLRANRLLLVVLLADAFHVIALDTLQHVRQQPMYTPLNPMCLLAVSPLVADAPTTPPVAAAPLPPPQQQQQQQQPTTTTTTTGGKDAHTATARNAESEAKRSLLVGQTHIAFPHNERGTSGAGGVLVLALRRTESESKPGSNSSSTTQQPSAFTDQRPETYVQTQVVVPAHSSAVTALALGHHRSCVLLLTASQRGSCLRLFDADTGVLLHELVHHGSGGARVTSVAIAHNLYTVAALLDNATLVVFDCERVIQLWRGARQQAYQGHNRSHGSRGAGGRVGWGALAWTTAQLKAAAAGFFLGDGPTSPTTITKTGNASLPSHSGGLGHTSRSNPYMRCGVLPLFSAQDRPTEQLSREENSMAVATMCCLRFRGNEMLWVGQYGVAECATTQSAESADLAGGGVDTEERCTLQLYNTSQQAHRATAAEGRGQHPQACEHIEIVL